MKLLVDMNLSPAWIPYLAEHGFEAVHWSSVGSPEAVDQVIFEYARASGMTIFTNDLDFTTILALSRAHRPSLLQARVQDLSPEFLGPNIVMVLRQCAADLDRGAVVTLLPDRSKVRILPI